jgi:hypothetical protein
MVSMLASSAVDRGFEFRPSQTKDHKIGIWYFSAKHVNTLSWIVLANWNNSPRVDMSLHLDTLLWFRTNQSLIFLLNAACLAEKV